PGDIHSFRNISRIQFGIGITLFQGGENLLHKRLFVATEGWSWITYSQCKQRAHLVGKCGAWQGSLLNLIHQHSEVTPQRKPPTSSSRIGTSRELLSVWQPAFQPIPRPDQDSHT